MKHFTGILPALLAGATMALLPGTGAAASVDSILDTVSATLDKYEAELTIDWQDRTLVLDGDIDEALIDQVVVDAARIDGVEIIENRLYAG